MPFNSDSIKDQSGKIAIITGANSGIGLATTQALALKGATVIMACRSPERAQRALDEIKKTSKGPVEVLRLDLADLNSIGEFSREFKGKYGKLDILINNAGVMALPFGKTKQGFETTFGINHLGHFALTLQLLDQMKNLQGSRIVTLSSLAHRFGKIDFENLSAEIKYRKNAVYSQSKLANLLFSSELSRRLRANGAKTISVSAHPGWTITNLQAHTRLFTFLNPFFGQLPAEGALPTLYAATAEDVKDTEYFGPGGVLELNGPPKRVECSARANDKIVAKKLWEISEKLTGIAFT